MVQLEDAVLARLDKDGHHFEIWVDPELAWDYKHGKEISNFRDMIAIDIVYSDAKKGDEVKHEFLKEIFETDFFEDIAKKIIKEGEVQLTTSQRNKMLERRKQEIIDFIAKNAHDPKENTPIPPQRIINALDEMKYKFNLSRNKEDEIHEVLLILKRAFPISLEKIDVSVEIPAKFTGKVQPLLHKYDIANEKWLPSGSLIATLKIPSGLKNILINDFNNVTHGEVTIKFEK
jgi:ribosome maturation protein SDO1